MIKTDSSFVLYCNYFKLKNRLVEIELKNHLVFTGKIIDFFRGNKTYISKWHLVYKNEFLGIDVFGFLIGKLINHEDICKIIFLEDNSIMNF